MRAYMWVCVCVYTHLRTSVYVLLCVCTCGPENNLGYFSLGAFFLVLFVCLFVTITPWDLESTDQASLAGQLPLETFQSLPFQCWDSEDTPSCHVLLHRFWRSNLGLHAWWQALYLLSCLPRPRVSFLMTCSQGIGCQSVIWFLESAASCPGPPQWKHISQTWAHLPEGGTAPPSIFTTGSWETLSKNHSPELLSHFCPDPQTLTSEECMA